MPDAEVPQGVDVGVGHGPQHTGGHRPLQRQRRRRLGHVFDVDAEPGRILRDPPQRRIGRCPAKPLLIEPRHGAIVDHHAVLIAPWRVEHLADVHGADVTRDHAIDQP